MTKLIVLSGLVSVEKSEVTIALADYFLQQGQSVTIFDNIARLPIDVPAALASQRIDGDMQNCRIS